MDIIRDRLEHEIGLAFAFFENQISRLFPGALGVLLNPLASLLYRVAAKEAVAKRAREQLEIYLECAERFDGGNLDSLVKENFDRFLKTEELYARGNRKHPRWKEVVALEREIFRGRIEPLVRLAREGRGESYEELTRTAFPSRREAEEVLERQLELGEKLIDLVRKEPGLAPIPSMLRETVLKLLGTGVEFARQTLEEQLDAAYGPLSPGGMGSKTSPVASDDAPGPPPGRVHRPRASPPPPEKERN